MARTRAVKRPNVVVGTDASAAARTACTRATQIASHNGAALHIVHAQRRIPAGLARLFGARASALDDALHELVEHAQAAGAKAKLHRFDNSPTEALRGIARRLAADLVVVGTRGRVVRNLVLGSTAERIAAGLRCPVLLARNPGHARYREVFVATDLDTAFGPAVRAARFVAPDRRLSVLHAYQGQFETTLMLHGVNARNLATYRAQARKEARTALRTRLQAAGLDRSAIVLRHGDPRNVLAATPKDTLLVISRDDSMLRHALLGSVTRAVVTEGEADMLIV